MQPDLLKKIDLLVPQDMDFENIRSAKPRKPYEEVIVEFLDRWSKRLLANPQSRLYPDVVTFAFWIRKGNLQRYKKEFKVRHEGESRLGKGIVFHIAPSNVPINFAYSLVTGMLAGDANIVKIPSKDFPQVTILCSVLEELLHEEQWNELHGQIALVKYDRTQKALTDFFSSFCDVRVIWGGDQTISDVRKSEIPARSFDICFADRYSLCVINADELVNETSMETVARGFYNDTYLFDQNACTAPHLVVWLGKHKNKLRAKDLFWSSLAAIVDAEYSLQAVTAVDKFISFCREAIQEQDVKREPTDNNAIIRVQLSDKPQDLVAIRGIGGYFNEYDAESLHEITSLVTRKFQTLSYYGVEKGELERFIVEERLVGIDRCTPIGKTLDFDVIWDGWDLVSSMSRVVNYKE
jgi:hypothetical protein